MRDIKAHKFAPVYVLMGEESYFIDKICDAIVENALTEDERSFNQDIMFGADTDSSRVADMARGYPMMAERRLIVVKEAQDMKVNERLEKYMLKPVPTTVLVLCHKNGSVDRRKKWLKDAETVGVVFESKKKYDNELAGFISGYLHRRDADIEPKAASMMAENVGSDLNRLASELDKLLVSIGDARRMVTADMVEAQIGVSKNFNSFELQNAIVNRDVLKANEIVRYFILNPTPRGKKDGGGLYVIPTMLFGYFQKLIIAHYAPNKQPAALAEYMGMKSQWFVRDYITGMRNYSALKTMQILDKIRETMAKLNGLDNPSTSQGDLVKELVFFILH